MIELFDTFNSVLISKHRSLETAVKAQRKHLKQVKKANGQNSYLTYGFVKNGKFIDDEEIFEVKRKLDESW